MNIKLNKKQLKQVLKAGYSKKDMPKTKGCYIIDSSRTLYNPSGWLLIRVKVEVGHGKKKVYITTNNSEAFNQYAAIKKIEELLNWK